MFPSLYGSSPFRRSIDFDGRKIAVPNWRTPPYIDPPRKGPFDDIMSPEVEEENKEAPLFGTDEQPESSRSTSLMDAFRDIMMQKQGPASTAYSKFLDQPAPDRDNYKPSKMRRIGAILSGAALGYSDPGAGIQAGQAALDQPFNKAREKYVNEFGRLKEAAGQEDKVHKDRMSQFKDVASLANTEADNKRADILAKDLMKTRAVNRTAAEERIKNAGMFHETDKTTGILYIVRPDGSKQAVGKFDQNTGERIGEEDVKNQFRSQQHIQEVKELAPFTSGLIEGRGNRAREDSQAHDIEMEKLRQSGRVAITDAKLKAAADRINMRINANKDPKISETIKRNLIDTRALVDSNPGKYGSFFNPDLNDPLGNPPSVDSPNYEDWRLLFNTLYRNTGHNISPSSKYKIERNE